MNYSELKAILNNFTEDDSGEFSNSIDTMVDLAEDMIYQRFSYLPCYKRSISAFMNRGTNIANFSSVRIIRNVSVKRFDDTAKPVYVEARVDSYVNDYNSLVTEFGQPKMYYIRYQLGSDYNSAAVGTTTSLFFAPIAGETYIVNVDTLSKDADSVKNPQGSWISANAEDLLTKASLYQAATFLKQPDMIVAYKAQFDEAAGILESEFGRSYHSEYGAGL